MSESSPLRQYTADHRLLLQAAARQAGFADPVALDADEFRESLVKAAVRGPVLPLDGCLVRDWDPDNRRTYTGVRFGLRLYTLHGVRFAWVSGIHDDRHCSGFDFLAVDRADYRRLYRLALAARRGADDDATPPVLPAAVRDQLWQNTIGYLTRGRLERIRAYGGRPKRGLLLSGPPGNGKTSACRWLWRECRRRRLEWRLVSPDDYQAARKCDNPAAAVKALFTLEKRGLVFFDDLDLALRDRDTVRETDDQAVFLGALDGIEPKEGLVYVFTTNCALRLIDPAFKRPGRIDLLLNFPPPDAALRRELIGRWHPEIVAALDVAGAVRSTEGFSFAEVEELKNLLILRHADAGGWDWAGALEQFAANRQDLQGPAPKRRVGFGAAVANGVA